MNKGKIKDDLVLYLGVDIISIGNYDGERDNRTESAMGLMACYIGAGDFDAEGNKFAEV